MVYIYGRNAVREALRAGRSVKKLYLATGAKPAGALSEVIEDAGRLGIPIVTTGAATLDRLSAGANHQGIVAEAAEFHHLDMEDILDGVAGAGHPALLLVLDHLADPQNLGTLLRTAEAAGVNGVLIPRERAAGITPAVEKASAGAVEHLSIAQVVNLPRAIDTLKERGLWVFGLDGSAEETYDQVDFNLPLALIVGSEGRGLSRLTREKCDILVRLPMRGRVESLNAAVAGSIVLYEILRKRAGSRRDSGGL